MTDQCASCGVEGCITSRDIEDKFIYGGGDDAIELMVTVPLRTCKSCGFEFFDYIAEQIRDEAVRQHLSRDKTGYLIRMEMKAEHVERCRRESAAKNPPCVFIETHKYIFPPPAGNRSWAEGLSFGWRDLDACKSELDIRRRTSAGALWDFKIVKITVVEELVE